MKEEDLKSHIEQVNKTSPVLTVSVCIGFVIYAAVLFMISVKRPDLAELLMFIGVDGAFAIFLGFVIIRVRRRYMRWEPRCPHCEESLMTNSSLALEHRCCPNCGKAIFEEAGAEASENVRRERFVQSIKKRERGVYQTGSMLIVFTIISQVFSISVMRTVGADTSNLMLTLLLLNMIGVPILSVTIWAIFIMRHNKIKDVQCHHCSQHLVGRLKHHALATGKCPKCKEDVF